MKKRELPELHDYSEDAEELMSRIPSKTVRWGLGIICGLLVAFLVASCFIRCPKYLWVESRMERVSEDSLGVRLTGVAFIKDQDMWKLEVGMPILYRYIQGEFKAYIAESHPQVRPNDADEEREALLRSRREGARHLRQWLRRAGQGEAGEPYAV